MMQVTDLYQEWLGVDPVESGPLTPYALLGLGVFESDQAKIRAAAERQRTRLERRQPASDLAQWNQIREELDHAIHTLLEPSRKSELDLQIRRQALVTEKPQAPQPPSDVKGEVPCPACTQSNAAQQRYCSGCGGGLWIECLACRQVMPAGENYCGGCGGNQDDVAEQLRGKTQRVIDEAVTLGNQFRFSEAMKVLSPLLLRSQHSLREQVQRAAELMDTFQAESSRWEKRSTALVEQAREAAEQSDFDLARRLLDSLPESLRNDECRRLLREVRSHADEVARLRTVVGEAIQQRQFEEASHCVERLLILNPNDAEADKIGRSLAQGLQKSADKSILKHGYATGLQMLQGIPSRYRDDQLERRIRQAAELTWLNADLRSARYIDATLVSVAQRLTKASPENESAAKLRKQLEQRVRRNQRIAENERAESGRLPGPIAWASPAGPSVFGFPIDWRTAPGRLLIESTEARANWTAHPGRFFVASGLALRGLGKATLELDLKPRRKAGMLGNFALTRSRKNEVKAAWGIDVSRGSLKAVRLVVTDGAVHVAGCVHLTSHRGESDGATTSSDSISRLIAKLRDTQEIDPAEPITVSLPSLKLLGRFLRVPRDGGKRFQQLLEYEIRHKIPFPMDDLCWDHHVVPDEEPGDDPTPGAVLVLAAKAVEVQRTLRVFEDANLKVAHLQSDAVALHNWWRFDQGTPADSEPTRDAQGQAVALLDVGAEVTQIVVSWPDSFWFRTIATGGNDVTRALAKNFRLTHDQARKLKHQPAKAAQLHPVFEVMSDINGRLRTQLQQSLDGFAQDFPGRIVHYGHGVGGGVALHGLLTDLYQSGSE